ncbi:MAG: tetratricopeptide repeat protein [Proteobacteria bacterium]|nr:tetratricopeptide repeat protein [Pseudomonadota bacterium]
MNSEKVKRKLVAILSADVKGYSRLMSVDEEATVRMLNTYKQAMGDLIRQYGGRVVDAPGDNLLAEFASVVDAVKCAVEIQEEIKDKNKELPEDRRMEFRIGINLGDVVEEGEKIFGDGVNIVARVEGLAEPVRVYRVLMEPGMISRGAGAKKVHPRPWRRAALSLGVVLIVIGAAVTVWHLYLRPTPPPAEVASQEKMAFPLPDKPSIAVLPFANLSKDPDQEYFIDGMTDGLITDLSKISGVFVIARTSTFTYKGKDVKVKQVAEELGVRYVLEGSVRRAGEQVRINAQLIDAKKGHHLWAERYDGSIEDIFALQDRITQKIVSALAVKLTGSEKELIAKKGTDNVAAYDAFLRGWGYYLRLTPEDFAKAAASFKRAIELDPNYGRAYAALSAVYWDASLMPALLKGLGVSWYEARARTIQYLEKATEDPIAHSVKSQRYLWRRQHQEAILEMERALALDPNDPVSLYNRGNALTYAGRPQEAIEFLKRGMRLDPHNPSRYLAGLGRAHFCMGELEEAVGLYEKAMRLNPKNAPWAWGGLSCSL